MAADLADPGLVRELFDDLESIDHVVFTAGEPLALMTMEHLDLDQARQFFGLRYFGALAQAYLYCLTQPFATGSILTVDGGTVLA